MNELNKIRGKVHIKLLDSTGQVLREIKDKNSETLWAQIATTPGIAVDFITNDWKGTLD